MALKGGLNSSGLNEFKRGGLNIPAGQTFNIGGTAITATAAEVNYLDITTLGTGAASKAVVLDAGEDYVWPATGVLKWGVLKDPANTTMSATAAELNLLDGAPANVTFSIAAGGSNVSEVTITVKDAAGSTLTGVRNLDIWLSDAASGAGLTGTTASGTVTAKSNSGTVLTALTAKKHLVGQTLAAGTFILEITDTAHTGFYVCVANPLTGAPIVSTQLVSGSYG